MTRRGGVCVERWGPRRVTFYKSGSLAGASALNCGVFFRGQ